MEWEDALKHVLPYTPGAPQSIVVDHLRKAARIFAAKSGVWTRESAVMRTVANRRTYPLDISKPDEELVRIKDVSIGTEPFDVLDDISGRAGVRRESSKRFLYVPVGREDVIVNPAPNVPNEAINITLVLKPGVDAPSVPAELEDFMEDISHGAIASLCSLPEKTAPWADDKQVTLHATIFAKRISSAMMQASAGYGGRKRRTRALYF